ncbi:hypothetical protein QN405_25745, partial [Pseudomonas sp. AH2 (2023)]|nr:hypothetical protein [Pseudomonas sp. AH2 (2023)]
VALFAGFFPVGALANISNSGTLFAFAAVSIAVMWLRRADASRARPVRTPAIYLVAPLSIAGCAYLFFSLDTRSQLLFAGWALIGLV